MFYFNFREDYEPFIPSLSTVSYLKEDIVTSVSSNSFYELIFVDGVMRKELNIVIEESLTNISVYSIGAGAVILKEEPRLIDELVEIRRVVVSDMTDDIRDRFLSEWSLRFKNTIFENIEFFSDITNGLRSLEEKVAKSANKRYNALIILDGPIQVIFKNVIGLVKTIREMYLERKDFLELKKIEVSKSRSGIFIIDRPRKYSWYVRLNYEPWIYSLIRLEASESSFSFEEIKRIADFTAVFLPMLVSPFDKRTPQNLAPVSFLEKTLKTLLGNSDIIKNIVREGY